MTIKRLARVSAAALAVTAFAAACGDDDDDGGDTPVEDVGDTLEGAVDDVTDDS